MAKNGMLKLIVIWSLIVVVSCTLSCGKKHPTTETNLTTAYSGYQVVTETDSIDTDINDTDELSASSDTCDPPLPEDYVQEDIDEPRETFDVKLEKLDPPTNVTASDGTYYDKVVIHWSHPTGGPAKPELYSVYRTDTPGGTFVYLGGCKYPGTYYYDTTTTLNKTYYYRIRSHRTGYNGSVSSDVDGGWRSDRLSAPVSVTASDGTHNDKVVVHWSHPSDGPATPDSYSIYRSVSPNGSFIFVGRRSYPGTYYYDTTATPGTTYYYKLRSYKPGHNASHVSNMDSGWMSDRMSVPTCVTASDGTYADKVEIICGETGGELPTTYYVYRSTIAEDSNPAYIGCCSYPSTSFSDTDVNPATIYYYKVKSHKTGYNDSYFSNEDGGYVPLHPYPPENVSASDGKYPDKVRIIWTHPPKGQTPTSYYIYRSTTEDDPAPKYIGGRSYPVTYFDDKTAYPGSTYYYKIKSYRSGFFDSRFSEEDYGSLEEPDWHIETVENAYYMGQYSSLALDSNDHPHISYYNGSNYDLKYAYHNGMYWMIKTVDSADMVGQYTSIALDSKDHPHISYYDSTNYDLKYAHYNGSSWVRDTVDSPGSVGRYTAIAVDSSDRPHISYYDETSSDLKYAYNNGSLWTTETADSGGMVGSYTDIAIDSSNFPHISYCSYSNGDLKYAYYNGTSWNITTVDILMGDAGATTSIALDSLDHPHISYYLESAEALGYAYFDGSSWSLSDVDSIQRVGYYSSIAIDSHDNPHISYYNATNEDLKYSYYNGSSWVLKTIDSTGDIGEYTSIALDSNGLPHISYCGGNGNTLKYAWLG